MVQLAQRIGREGRGELMRIAPEKGVYYIDFYRIFFLASCGTN
jgi:hypothetical protein